ncbi:MULTISPECIES: hypothetical protein [unclassified Paraburkholderia]|uniref:hypothetical protein n=1 Tax=unclassified Paraburkholderia TaxID=2615204 RepID=UPI002AB68EB5|nr:MULTISPECIES: hypothetical protein [unclassified Paraburkholderia]
MLGGGNSDSDAGDTGINKGGTFGNDLFSANSGADSTQLGDAQPFDYSEDSNGNDAASTVQRVLIAKHPVKRCVVVMWFEEKQALVSYTLEEEKVLSATARLFPLEVPVANYSDTLDDEFAWRFGGATLNLLALSNPGLKPYIKVTQADD